MVSYDNFLFFYFKKTIFSWWQKLTLVTSLTLLAVYWTQITLLLSLQHSRRHFLWISGSHSTHILLLLSCHFPKQVSCDFERKKKRIFFLGNFILPLYSSQVFVQLTCKGDDNISRSMFGQFQVKSHVSVWLRYQPAKKKKKAWQEFFLNWLWCLNILTVISSEFLYNLLNNLFYW